LAICYSQASLRRVCEIGTFRADSGSSYIRDLGTLNGFEKASFARAVNASGQIVGESDSDSQKRAFVYTSGKMFDLTELAINLRKAGFPALDVADGINSQGWIVGFGTTLDWRINAFLAIPVGVTADPPGGPDAPVFDSGAIIGTAWFGVGWFCPPNLWQPPWHHHPHLWPTPPQIQIAHRGKPTPTPSHHNNEGRHNEGHNGEGHHKDTGTTHVYDPHKGAGENSGRRSTHVNNNTEHHPTPLKPRSSPTPPHTLKRRG